MIRNYKGCIEEALRRSFKNFHLADDPNQVIDSVMGKKRLKWYPAYLAINNSDYFLFMPFSFESFLDESEVRKECKAAQQSIDCLKEKNLKPKVIFITSSVDDTIVLQRLELSSDFGILHYELDSHLLELPITHYSESSRLLRVVLKYLAGSKNLRGATGDILRQFAKECLTKEMTRFEEERAIKRFIENILTCDDRFKLNTKLIHFMASIEQTFSEYRTSVRDHYFHACNTMLIGFMIIDKFYHIFKNLSENYGKTIVVEFIWAITSLYHDIGHTAYLQSRFMGEAYNFGEDDPVTESCSKQIRQILWENKYIKYASLLDNLFNHINVTKRKAWSCDPFLYEVVDSNFTKSLKKSFIDEGAHGAQGLFILVSLIDQAISQIENPDDRKFLYLHILLASISILFHDSRVRNSFRSHSINKLKASKYPYSCLLTYADILQDDRRDMSGVITRSDIFEDITFYDKKIVAKLNPIALETETKRKILGELKEAFDFFVMNGVTFGIPVELTN